MDSVLRGQLLAVTEQLPHVYDAIGIAVGSLEFQADVDYFAWRLGAGCAV